MNGRKKELKRIYKEEKQKVGVYCISFKDSNTVFIGSSRNLDKVINKHVFTLRYGSHRCKKFQLEFNEFGENMLDYKVLEEIDTKDINPILLKDIIKDKKAKWVKKFKAVDIF